jgi:hypothetical protein
MLATNMQPRVHRKEEVMVRTSSIILGVGLIALWLVGLANHATAWLTWLVGVGGLCAFGIAAAVSPDSRIGERRGYATPVGGPIALAIGLFVLWIVALSIGATGWLAWWTFAGGCAFLILGLLAIGEQAPSTPTVTHPRTI